MKIASLILFFSISSFAFIPKGLVILQKTAENNGTGSFQIEQEVHFQTAQEPFVLKEVWLVDSDNTMKLTVSGTKELKDQLKMQFLYSGGQRLQQIGTVRQSKRLSEDFIESYFHFRSGERFANHLIQLKVVPATILVKKNPKTSKEVENMPEDFLRLSRVGGVVSYAFGTPAQPDSSDRSPGFWIEQDQFVLRKFRLPSGIEVSAEKYSQYARGFNFPRKRVVRWDNNLVQLQTLNVTGRSSGQFGALEPSKMDVLDSLSIKNQIVEFYNRFR